MEDCAQDQNLRRNSRAFVKRDSKGNNAIVSKNVLPPYTQWVIDHLSSCLFFRWTLYCFSPLTLTSPIYSKLYAFNDFVDCRFVSRRSYVRCLINTYCAVFFRRDGLVICTCITMVGCDWRFWSSIVPPSVLLGGPMRSPSLSIFCFVAWSCTSTLLEFQKRRDQHFKRIHRETKENTRYYYCNWKEEKWSSFDWKCMHLLCSHK